MYHGEEKRNWHLGQEVTWIIGILLSIILAGAGWNENKQWQNADEQTKTISDLRADLAVIKQTSLQNNQYAKDNNELNKEHNDKLDIIIRKQNAILDRQSKK